MNFMRNRLEVAMNFQLFNVIDDFNREALDVIVLLPAAVKTGGLPWQN